MVGRFLLITILLVGVMLIAVEQEREYRELQSLRVRQVYQKQVLLEQRSRLRLNLQRNTRPQNEISH
ncbi:MAG: hypothetical protein JKY95_13350 [Planctomycetaceae bacterium]|nr:hypothetical protein [Planctomycetaceae bacterium]